MKLLDDLLKRMNGSRWSSVTPSANLTFKGEEEYNTSHIFIINFIVFRELKENRCMLNN